jgi:hypothetical protein
MIKSDSKTAKKTAKKTTKKTTKKPRNTRIEYEIKRLTKIFANIEKEKLDLCKKLIENAAFMSVSLKDLQETIQQDGWVEEYQNGANQKGKKTGSAALLYVKLSNNYRQIIADLVKLLPKTEQELARMASDPMLDFLNDE